MATLASIASPLYAADVAEYQALETKTQAACKKVLLAVVGVAPGGKGGSPGVSEMGSGVVVNNDGHILTAAHVVEKPGTEATESVLTHPDLTREDRSLPARRSHRCPGLLYS